MKLYKKNGLVFIDSGYTSEYVELLESEVEQITAELKGLINRLKEIVEVCE